MHLIHNGSVPGKVRTDTWGEKRKEFPSITMAHFIAAQLTMFFVQLVVLLQYPVMRNNPIPLA